MRLAPTLALTLAAITFATVPAVAGAPIRKAPGCPNSYLVYSPQNVNQFRAAMLCLVNAVRKTQHLPALKRNAKLESVAQAQSKGSGGHGKTLAEIGKRFQKKGYKPAAYNEGFTFLDKPRAPTPYGFIAEAMSHQTVPCSEILDPRFRDLGVGISEVSGAFYNMTLEFGLKQGAKQPSTDYTKAASCPHKLPAPVFTTLPVDAGDLPKASGGTVTAGLMCSARSECVIDSAKLTLFHAKVSSELAAPVTIAAGQKGALTFQFDPAAVESELGSSTPAITLAFSVAKPAQYDDLFDGPLMRG
jgi:hypothetical protein